MTENEFRMSLYYICFLKFGEKYYARKLIPSEIWLVFEDGKWNQCEHQEGEHDELSVEEAYDLFKDVPPQGVFESIERASAKQAQRNLDEAVKTTKRRVIGWAYRPYGHLEENTDLDEEEYAAIVKDIREHNYKLSGEQYQDEELEPVFEDYRFATFSRRGFGGLIADAYGNNTSPFSYSLYMERESFRNTHAPEAGRYGEFPSAQTLIRVPKQFKEQVGQYVDKGMDFEEMIHYYLAVPMPEDGYYFLGDQIEVVDEETNEYLGAFRLESIFVAETIDVLNGMFEYAKNEEAKSLQDKKEHDILVEAGDDDPGMTWVTRYFTHKPDFDTSKPFLILDLMIAGYDF